MKLTDGEKAIWAAVFALEMKEAWRARTERGAKVEYDDNSVPTYVSSATENAWYAVWCARNGVASVEAGFGENDDVTNALRSMLK